MAKKSTRVLDLEAREEHKSGATKRKYSSKDLCSLIPKTQAQRDLISVWNEDKSISVTGSAGTGKTFLALWLALREVFDGDYRQLVIIRSIVPSREVGFLPGLLEDKIEVYETPYKALCDDIFEYSNTYEGLKKNDYVGFESTSFLRGRTFDNTIILVDECQNMTFQELHTVLTRVGEGSKIIFVGDTRQVDLVKKNDKSGFEEFMKIITKMKSFEHIEFLPSDVVRSGLVREYLMLLEE